MPATTPEYDFPYPLPTEPVTEGAQAIRNLAERIEAVLPAEPWHEVGAAGEPGFQWSWVNEGGAGKPTAAFYKDALGIVHLKGSIKDGTNLQVAWILPAGYWPAQDVRYVSIAFDGTAERLARIDVSSVNGQVQVSVIGAAGAIQNVSLLGAFRAA